MGEMKKVTNRGTKLIGVKRHKSEGFQFCSVDGLEAGEVYIRTPLCNSAFRYMWKGTYPAAAAGGMVKVDDLYCIDAPDDGHKPKDDIVSDVVVTIVPAEGPQGGEIVETIEITGVSPIKAATAAKKGTKKETKKPSPAVESNAAAPKRGSKKK